MNDETKPKGTDAAQDMAEELEIPARADDAPEKEINLNDDGEIENEPEADDVVFDDEAELSSADIIKRLRSKLKLAVEEKQAYLNGWQRDKAEFVNARKRDEDSKQEFLKFAKSGMIEDLLPVLDSFDMAMSDKKAWESTSKEWQDGFEGIYNQFLRLLLKNDVRPFGAIGDIFDPNLHHSIGSMPAEKKSQDQTVGMVMQKGYMMSGKVVRPALVKVFEI